MNLKQLSGPDKLASLSGNGPMCYKETILCSFSCYSPHNACLSISASVNQFKSRHSIERCQPQYSVALIFQGMISEWGFQIWARENNHPLPYTEYWCGNRFSTFTHLPLILNTVELFIFTIHCVNPTVQCDHSLISYWTVLSLSYVVFVHQNDQTDFYHRRTCRGGCGGGCSHPSPPKKKLGQLRFFGYQEKSRQSQFLKNSAFVCVCVLWTRMYVSYVRIFSLRM